MTTEVAPLQRLRADIGLRDTANGPILDRVPTIGENIRMARKAAGFRKQADLATAAGLSQPRISDWETDRYGAPDLASLLALASAMHVSLDVLVAGQNEAYDQLRHADVVQGTSERGAHDGSKTARLPTQREAELTAQLDGLRSYLTGLSVEVGAIAKGRAIEEARRAAGQRPSRRLSRRRHD